MTPFRDLKCLLLLCAILTLLPLFSGCGKAPSPTADAEVSEEAACTEGDGCESEDSEERAEGEASDLDLPLEELKEASCEHEMATYLCPQCRFAVGVARAPAALFDTANGGPLTLQAATVKTEASGAPLAGEVRLLGEHSAWVSPRVGGIVTALRADLGQKVEAGQVLYEVESEAFRAAKAAFIAAKAGESLAESVEQRQRSLFEKRIAAGREVQEAQAALSEARARRAQCEGDLFAFGMSRTDITALGQNPDRAQSGRMAVRAPFAGVVLERELAQGLSAEPGARLLLLGDTSEVTVVAALHERELAALLSARAGGEVAADIEASALPGRVFRGKVVAVGGTLNSTTRTAEMRLAVPNAEGLLREGMLASVRLRLPGAEGALSIPEEAVLEDEGRRFVFVPLENEYFIRRPVATGRASGGWVEVLSGLEEGQSVVSRGAFLLKSDVLRAKMGAGCAD